MQKLSFRGQLELYETFHIKIDKISNAYEKLIRDLKSTPFEYGQLKQKLVVLCLLYGFSAKYTETVSMFICNGKKCNP